MTIKLGCSVDKLETNATGEDLAKVDENRNDAMRTWEGDNSVEIAVSR